MAESVNSAVSNLNHGGLVALVGMVPVESAFCAPPAGPGERAARGPELNGTELNGTERNWRAICGPGQSRSRGQETPGGPSRLEGGSFEGEYM